MAEVIEIQSINQIEKGKIFNALINGEIIAYPTDTIYGLGVDIYAPRALQRLAELKGRPSKKPFSLLYASVSRVLFDFKNLNTYQKRFLRAILPGPVTLLLPAPPLPEFPDEVIFDSYIGVRVIRHKIVELLLSEYPNPISTTSANPSGMPPALNIDEILSYFSNGISVVIDSGMSRLAVSSTVVRVLDSSYEVLREGAISVGEIHKKVQRL